MSRRCHGRSRKRHNLYLGVTHARAVSVQRGADIPPVALTALEPIGRVARPSRARIRRAPHRHGGWTMERRRVIALRRGAVLVAAYASLSAGPAAATPAPPAISVTAGWQHNCAVLADHTARCWGYNGDGELGNGTANNFSLRPVTVSGLGD